MTFEGSVIWHVCYRCCCFGYRCCCLWKCCLIFSFKINQLRRKVIHKIPIHWESHFEAHDDMWHQKLLDKVLSTPMTSRRNQRTQIIYTRNIGKFLPFFRLLSLFFTHSLLPRFFTIEKFTFIFEQHTLCFVALQPKEKERKEGVCSIHTRGKASFTKSDKKKPSHIFFTKGTELYNKPYSNRHWTTFCQISQYAHE